MQFRRGSAFSHALQEKKSQREQWEKEQREQYVNNYADEHPEMGEADARQKQLEIHHDDIKWKILTEVVAKNSIFKNLHSEQKQAVCDAMVPIATHSGEEIIKEGLVGDFFYVVFSGTYSAYKKGRTAPLKQYSKGESFGELALLFTQPRQATILCDTSGTLYAIDRKTFKRVVAENALKGKTPKSEEQQMLQAMTANINLSKLSLVQQKKVCALMEKRQVAVGETVIREGDVGDYFYAVASGTFDVTKSGHSGVLMSYKKGECFGDVALVRHDNARAATVKARVNGVVYRLKRSDFRIVTGLDIPASVTAARLALKLQRKFRKWVASNPPGMDRRPPHLRLFQTPTKNSVHRQRDISGSNSSRESDSRSAWLDSRQTRNLANTERADRTIMKLTSSGFSSNGNSLLSSHRYQVCRVPDSQVVRSYLTGARNRTMSSSSRAVGSQQGPLMRIVSYGVGGRDQKQNNTQTHRGRIRNTSGGYYAR